MNELHSSQSLERQANTNDSLDLQLQSKITIPEGWGDWEIQFDLNYIFY